MKGKREKQEIREEGKKNLRGKKKEGEKRRKKVFPAKKGNNFETN